MAAFCCMMRGEQKGTRVAGGSTTAGPRGRLLSTGAIGEGEQRFLAGGGAQGVAAAAVGAEASRGRAREGGQGGIHGAIYRADRGFLACTSREAAAARVPARLGLSPGCARGRRKGRRAGSARQWE